jgi:5-methylcytosine-specific restriction endonuclease McrA
MPTAKDLYSQSAWMQVRAAQLAKTGSRCEMCGAQPAEGYRIEVHHVSQDSGRFLDPTNLQTLCRACHMGLHYWQWARTPAANDPHYSVTPRRPRNYAQLKFDF